MRVGERGVRNQRTGQQQIARRGNEVAGFVPEVRQSQQRQMGNEQAGEEERVDEEVFADLSLGLP